MNGQEKNTAIAMSGLMKFMSEEKAWSCIQFSDYCVGLDMELMKNHLDNILNGGIVPELDKPTDLPEELFTL